MRPTEGARQRARRQSLAARRPASCGGCAAASASSTRRRRFRRASAWSPRCSPGAWASGRGGRRLLSLLYPADIAGARAALARLDLADRLFDRCDRLSGGQLQRVGVARVLYQQPGSDPRRRAGVGARPALADAARGRAGRARPKRAARRWWRRLHAVDLALRWFPRIVGLRERRSGVRSAARAQSPTRCCATSTPPRAAVLPTQAQRRRAPPKRAPPRRTPARALDSRRGR